MILTPLKIQLAIIKAYYNMALKSIKYYTGLALGKNNNCLLKEARLLRAYVDILRNFEIVGSTVECDCCLEGDYTFLLNDLSQSTLSNIQFSCDNTGYLVFNGVGYPFTYIYDPSNSTLKISLVDNYDNSITINLAQVQFTDTCNVINYNDGVTPGLGSPLLVATNTTGTPITVENQYGDWSGELSVLDDGGDPYYGSVIVPAGLLADPQAVVDLWNNSEYGDNGWLLYYNGTSYVMTTPLEVNQYFTDYTFEFKQYEGGSEPTINFPSQRLRVEYLEPYLPSTGILFLGGNLGSVTFYQDLLPKTYNNIQDFIDTINNFTNCTAELVTNTSPTVYDYVKILPPENSFNYFSNIFFYYYEPLPPTMGVTTNTPPNAKNFIVNIPDITEYTINQIYTIEFSANNNTPGDTTLNINGLGEITIYFNGTPIPPGYIVFSGPPTNITTTLMLQYDGTNFNVIPQFREERSIGLVGGEDPKIGRAHV